MRQMRPLLQGACALECSNLWCTKQIHEIRATVARICAWQAEAEAKATEAAEEAAATARVAAEAEVARAVVMRREVEVFETVTVVAGPETPPAVIVLTAENREGLRKMVQRMRINIFILKSDVAGYNPDNIALLTSVVAYHESCVGDDTWVWDAEAWKEVSGKLQTCLTFWKKMCKDKDSMLYVWRLKRECEACVDDMAQYKLLCDNGGKKDATTWAERARRLFRLQSNLQALKALD
jgi:hypothetical protein